MTFVDSCVLVAAVRGKELLAGRAFAGLGDPAREFASSVFIRMELLPKAVHDRRQAEVAFYETFLAAVNRWAEPDAALLPQALGDAERCGMSAMDALHVVAAHTVGADELVTTERISKPMHRTSRVRVISLHG